MVGDEFSHLAIKRRQDLVGRLDDGDSHSAFHEVLGHFKADKTGACYNRLSRPAFVNPLAHPPAVRDGTKGEDASEIDPGQWGPDGGCAWRQYKGIVGFAAR